MRFSLYFCLTGAGLQFVFQVLYLTACSKCRGTHWQRYGPLYLVGIAVPLVMADLTRHVLQGESVLCLKGSVSSKLTIARQLLRACYGFIHSVGPGDTVSSSWACSWSCSLLRKLRVCTSVPAFMHCTHDNICSADVSNDAVTQIRAFGLALPAACTSLIAGTQKGALADSHASV